jgi:hypothetical protein
LVGPNQRLWTPSLITTALWLDAADASSVTTVSGNVSQWNDKSGNGRNAAQSTAGNRPAYQSAAQNGLNAVRFTAASEHFLTAGTTSAWNFLHNGTASSVFVVSRVRSTGDNPDAAHAWIGTCSTASFDTGVLFFYDDRNAVPRNNSLASIVYKGAGSGVTVAVTSVDDLITPGAYSISSVYLDTDNATAGNRIKFRVNGGSDSGSNTSTNSVSAGNSTDVLNIGSIGTGAAARTFYLTGDICEILILNTLPDTTNRQRIEGYLAHKWGLTAKLPSDHPFKIVPPAR